MSFAMIQRHPWDKWFRTRRFTLIHGRDYKCQPHGMAVQVRQQAGMRGLSASISVVGKRMTVFTQEKGRRGLRGRKRR